MKLIIYQDKKHYDSDVSGITLEFDNERQGIDVAGALYQAGAYVMICGDKQNEKEK